MLTTLRHRVSLLTATAVVLALASGVAWAQNAHFVPPVTATLQGTNVQVCFREAGLGRTTVNLTASALASATYVCLNNGGKCLGGPHKTTVNSVAQDSDTFTSDANGNIISCELTLSPSSAGMFHCPGGQTLILASVSYNAPITVTDITNDVSATTTPNTLSTTPFTCP
jgi:hypothetical protein